MVITTVGFIRVGNTYIPIREITQIVIEMTQAYIWTDDEEGKYRYSITSQADIYLLREWMLRQDVLWLTDAKEGFDE